MKKAKFYVLKPGFGKSDIIAVTSEKGGQVYGRYLLNDMTTHFSSHRKHYRYDTLEEVLAIKEKVDAVIARYKPLHEAASKETMRLHREEKAEVNALGLSTELW
jgi:hypothetical protein